MTQSSRGSNPVSSCRHLISVSDTHVTLQKDAVTACDASDGGLQLRHSDIARVLRLHQSQCTPGAAIANFR